VETCSTFAWIQLNRELLAITGDARFAEEIEKAAYNDLLGAQAPAGDNWCYYSFPNGRRVYTTYWRCCKSSGPWALEEVAATVCTVARGGDISVNLYGPGRTTLTHAAAGRVRIDQDTLYPYDGAIRLSIDPERSARFMLRLRIPAWAASGTLRVNGQPGPATSPGTYANLDREWRAGDVVELYFPMPARLHRKVHRNIQESRAPDGSPVAQEVLHFEYAAVTRGPLVYATGLIDGFKTDETVRLPAAPESEWLTVGAPSPGSAAPTVRLAPVGRAPLVFVPYIEAGGRADGTWRLTWLSLAPS
jgi:hypothetical protein